ncbi:MAG: DUF935 domain-containing protein [Anaerovoracaceae bacterium]
MAVRTYLAELFGRFRYLQNKVMRFMSSQDKFSEYPSNGLTPEKLAALLMEADLGEVKSQMELFEEMEEKDPHLFSQLQTRKNAVTGLEWEIIAAGSSSLDKDIAQFVEKALSRIEEFENVLFDLLDAIGKGISISEIIWDFDENKGIYAKEINWLHPKRLMWDVKDRILIRTDRHPEGEELTPNKFVVHKYKARSGHPARAGILRVVVWMYLFKNYDVKDWVRFCEIFGMPIRIGKYNPGASEEDKKALMEALVSLGSDAAGIMPEGTSIDIQEAQKQSSVDAFERLARYCDEQISKAVLGQTLTADSGGGSYAQGKVHNDVRHDLTVADCKALASTLKRDLITPIVRFNFGLEVEVPEIKFDCKEPEDLKTESEILDTLINKVGLKVTSAYVYNKFNIPHPEEGEEILEGQTISVMEQEPERQQALKTLSLKLGTQEKSQDQIDKLVEKSTALSEHLFKKMYSPLKSLLEEAETLEELKAKLETKEEIEKLFSEMDTYDFEELMQRALMAADMQGRVIEYE